MLRLFHKHRKWKLTSKRGWTPGSRSASFWSSLARASRGLHNCNLHRGGRYWCPPSSGQASQTAQKRNRAVAGKIIMQFAWEFRWELKLRPCYKRQNVASRPAQPGRIPPAHVALNQAFHIPWLRFKRPIIKKNADIGFFSVQIKGTRVWIWIRLLGNFGVHIKLQSVSLPCVCIL